MPCADCFVETGHGGIGEYYMVTREIWAIAGAGKGYLCIGCLERRLGRRLTPADFVDAPINDPVIWGMPVDRLRSARILNRLGRG